MTGEFSVCQFFDDDSCEYVRRGVSAEEAVHAFGHYTTNVVARLGIIVKRVVVTDGGDNINMEWQRGKGVTFYRPRLSARATKGGRHEIRHHRSEGARGLRFRRAVIRQKR